MMSRKTWGIVGPIGVSVGVMTVALLVFSEAAVRIGIIVGLLLALFQSFVTTGALNWAWKKPFFYWVWGGGILFRLIVFGFTAFVVHFHTRLNLVATLLSMVLATTLFMIVESLAFLKKSNGFSSSSRT